MLCTQRHSDTGLAGQSYPTEGRERLWSLKGLVLGGMVAHNALPVILAFLVLTPKHNDQ